MRRRFPLLQVDVCASVPEVRQATVEAELPLLDVAAAPSRAAPEPSRPQP